MKKQFDEFQKMKIKETCKAIHDMTYTYVNPETKKPTDVPAKHYEAILNQTVEETIEERVQLEILNTIYKQILNLKTEYQKDFFRSLVCIEMNLKPNDLSIIEKIALDRTYENILGLMEKEKKKFHFLKENILQSYEEAINDTSLHASLFVSIDDDNSNLN